MSPIFISVPPSNSHVTNSRFRGDDDHLLERVERGSGPSRLACVHGRTDLFGAGLLIRFRILLVFVLHAYDFVVAVLIIWFLLFSFFLFLICIHV